MARFLQIFSSSCESFNTAEEASVDRMAVASSHVAGQDMKTVTPESCADYLAATEAAAIQLKMPPAPRKYRASLPLNYRSLFPTEARSYRADVLEASLEHYNVIWVNGEKFEFSSETSRLAEELQVVWMDLGATLARWTGAVQDRPSKNEIVSVLKALDSSWAMFEERYISELVQIEAKARNHIVHAIELESRLTQLEDQGDRNLPEYKEVQYTLVCAISHMNSVANVSGKGRDDLNVEVLTEAQFHLGKCDPGSPGRRESTLASTAASVLSTDVVESFSAMRNYLREVSKCMERVDPHLGNNAGLVTRLQDWEECWEVGTAYLQKKPVLNALCDAVAEIQRVQAFAPKLANMCEECDVELFMVLPRMVWLRFLAEPSQQSSLLSQLLPHHFVAASDKAPSLGPELRAFHDKYRDAECILANMCETPMETPTKSLEWVRALLAKRVVNGGDAKASDIYEGIREVCVDDARVLVDGLIHALEAWSMELQRHCPEDWNQYSAVLVHCLSTEEEKERNGPFAV